MGKKTKNTTHILDEMLGETQPTSPTDIKPAFRFGKDTPGDVLLPVQPAFGLKLGSVETYTPIPETQKHDAAELGICWRIELHGLAPDVPPLGFDLMGDAVLGRADEANSPDCALIDLNPYQAQKLGVSRQHALLRPTKRALFLLDMNSANGTFHNAMRLKTSFVRALSDDDTLSLGNLTFQVKIIDRPRRSGAADALPPER